MLKSFRHIIRPAGCLVAALAGCAAHAGDTGASFFDGFDGLNRSRWMASDGWSNGTWQNCLWSSRAIAVRDGLLVLTFRKGKSAQRDYLCGEVQSRESYGYGTYEARMKTGAGTGLNAAFFSYIGPAQGQPHDEVDVEILLKDTSRLSLNSYVSGEARNGATVGIPASDTGFNTYAFQWAPDGLRWFVNGRLVHEATAQDGLPTTPQRIFLSLWGSDTLTDWMGPFEPPSGPVSTEVDWVAFTRAGEPCQFLQSLLCGTR